MLKRNLFILKKALKNHEFIFQLLFIMKRYKNTKLISKIDNESENWLRLFISHWIFYSNLSKFASNCSENILFYWEKCRLYEDIYYRILITKNIDKKPRKNLDECIRNYISMLQNEREEKSKNSSSISSNFWALVGIVSVALTNYYVPAENILSRGTLREKLMVSQSAWKSWTNGSSWFQNFFHTEFNSTGFFFVFPFSGYVLK